MLLLIIAIYTCFSLNGIFAETYYHSGIQVVPCTQLLISYLICFIIAYNFHNITNKPEVHQNPVPRKYGIIIGLLLCVSQLLTYYGFMYVSFFVGNLVKSSKTIAILAIALISRDWRYLKSLTIKSYIAVIGMTYGIFSYSLLKKENNFSLNSQELYGFFLLFLGLIMETIVMNTQRK